MNKKIILSYRLLLLVLAFVGVYLEIAKLGVGMLMYYTVLSNLLVLLFTAYLIFRMWTDNNWESSKLLRVKGGVTMKISFAITLCLSCFSLILLYLIKLGSTVGLIPFLGQVFR